MVSAPKAPDPYATAQAQATMNKETAVAQTGLNAMDQFTPDGRLNYAQNGTWSDGTPRFNVTQTLSPDNQKLYDLNSQTQQNLGQIGVSQSDKIAKLLGTPLNLNVGDMPTAPTGSTNRYSLPGATTVASRYAPDAMMVDRADIGSNADLEKRLIDLGNERLNPQLQRQRADLDASLADKGIKVNSDAYSRAMTDNGQTENDARNQLILSGQNQAFQQALARSQNTFGQDIQRTGQYFNQGAQKAQQDFTQDLAGRQQYFTEAGAGVANEQLQDQSMFDRAMQAYQGQMQGRQQTIDEILQARNQPINEISALMSGSQIAKPEWTSTPQSSIATPDLMGLVASNYAAKSQQYSGLLSGLGSLAGNALGFGLSKSDARLKTDIKRVGKLDNGLAVYQYRFKDGGPIHIGVMAQEVAQVRPEAVHVMPDGFLAVDYGMATEAA